MIQSDAWMNFGTTWLLHGVNKIQGFRVSDGSQEAEEALLCWMKNWTLPISQRRECIKSWNMDQFIDAHIRKYYWLS